MQIIAFHLLSIYTSTWKSVCRSQWPCGLRHRSSAARLLRSWVRIPPGAWMFVCCECCMLSGKGLCDGLITRPEESYRLWRVVVCDQETSKTSSLKPATGLWKTTMCHKARKTNRQINLKERIIGKFMCGDRSCVWWLRQFLFGLHHCFSICQLSVRMSQPRQQDIS